MSRPIFWDPKRAGIEPEALHRYIEEQIYSLAGIEGHRDLFTILLTGSRALARHTTKSDVDIDVLCPEQVYEQLQKACYEAGITRSQESMWCPLSIVEEDWRRYFGGNSVPHFCVRTLESVESQFAEFDDVGLWIWTNARIIADPEERFGRMVESFSGYPKEVLARKLKYHWLLCWYWGIEVYPFHHKSDAELLTAGTAVLNAILEMMRVFFLVEGRPYPYTEKLPDFVSTTRLGDRFGGMLKEWVDLVVGNCSEPLSPWERLDLASTLLTDDVNNPETALLEEETTKAIIAAGVDSDWMKHYFSNIDELLLGKLGAAP